MDILLYLVGIVALCFVVLFFIRRSDRNREEREREGHDGYVQSEGYNDYPQSRREGPPVIIRRPPEVYMPSGHDRKDSNVTSSELQSIRDRLLSLERDVRELSKAIAQLNAGPRSDSKISLSDRSRQQEELKNIDARIRSAANEAPSPNSSTTAKYAYHKLSTEGLRNLPIEPLFVFLDVDSSAIGSAVGESQRLFRQSDNKQNAFVIFQNDRRDGWLFPNPRISYTESMRYVFPELSHENYEGFKNDVEPKRVKMAAEEMWEMLPD
jgi:hypothetical protein